MEHKKNRVIEIQGHTRTRLGKDEIAGCIRRLDIGHDYSNFVEGYQKVLLERKQNSSLDMCCGNTY